MKINSKKTYFNIEQFEILIDYIGLLQTREILSSWAGHKVARIALSDKKIINTVSILNKIGLYVEIKKEKIFLKKDIGKAGWSNKFQEGENLNPKKGEWLLYVSNSQKKSFKAMRSDENNDESALGEDLGIPNCCIDFYDMNKERAYIKQNDFVPFVLENTKGQGPYNYWNNYVSQYFGYSLLSFFPCSFNCKNAVKFAQNTYDLINNYLPYHANQILHFQKQNIIYTEYNGIHMYENSKFDKIKNNLDISKSIFHSTLKSNAKSLDTFSMAKSIKIIDKKHIEIINISNTKISLNNNNIANCIFN